MSTPSRRGLPLHAPVRRGRWLVIGMLGAAPLPTHAANVCVDTSAELESALTSAAASAESDIIRVAKGDYTLAQSMQRSITGGLELYGGIGSCSGFSSISIDPAATRIRAGSAQEIDLQLRLNQGDYEIRSLSFLGFRSITIDDIAAGNQAAASLSVSNNRFEDGALGLLLDLDTTDARVENNLFANNVGPAAGGDYGLRLQHDVANSAPLQAIIAFNTVIGSPLGLHLQGGGPLNGDVRLHNNIFDAGSNAGTAVALDAISARSYDSLWLGQRVFSNGAAFAVVEYSLEAASMLGPDFVPLAGSQAVNTGFDLTQLLIGGPASDIDGGRRIIGSKPDRGAFESAISDIPVLTVTNASNSGAGSLRQAILDSNVSSNAETIEFNIPGACPQTIVLTSLLPDVTSPLTIDGFTQPGSSPNQQLDAYDGVHCVQLGSTLSHGLRLEPAANQIMTVRGLLFFGFSQAAIEVEGAGAARIEGNRFGGLSGDPGIYNDGIFVIGASGTVIGGQDRQQRNLITRAAGAGVSLGAGAQRQVVNNLIGLGADGYSAAGNGVGIHLVDGSGDLISGNVIGHSTAQGILAERPMLGKHAPARTANKGGPETYTRIEKNYIGRSLRSTPAQVDVGNGTNGVRFVSGNNWQIENNIIAYNHTDGVVVLGAVLGANLLGNLIYDNGQLGIDLSPDDVDTQTPDSGATGANGTQNFPLLDAAEGGIYAGVVRGQLRSSPGTYTIELYYNATCDGSGHGEGRDFVPGGTLQVTIPTPPFPTPGVDSSVSFSAAVVEDFDGFADRYLVALARNNGTRNTSEFSACIPYVVTDVYRDGFE